MNIEVPDGVPSIPADAMKWQKVYADGLHTVFEAEGPSRRWRFGPRGFLVYIEYDVTRDALCGEKYWPRTFITRGTLSRHA